MKKVIVITGGNDGLGKAIATRLARAHTVVIMSTNEAKCVASAKEIGCEYIVCDVSDSTQTKKVIAEVIQHFSCVDVLINNAGIWIEGPLEECDSAQIKNVIEVNTLGTIYMSQAVLPILKRNGSGQIINIISQAGLKGKGDRAVYTASKFAITGLTKSLQEELAPQGIGVTGIYPGKLKTGMFEKVGITKSFDDALDPGEVAKAVEMVVNTSSSTLYTEIGLRKLTAKM